MAIKRFYFPQLAGLRIEDVGIHAGYAITLIVNEEDNTNGKKIRVSALDKSNAAKQQVPVSCYSGV